MTEHEGNARASLQTAVVRLYLSAGLSSPPQELLQEELTHSIVKRTCFLDVSGNGASNIGQLYILTLDAG